jgi:hypothetical protein
MSGDPWKAAAPGFVLNLTRVMLKLSEPFLGDPRKGKKKKKKN